MSRKNRMRRGAARRPERRDATKTLRLLEYKITFDPLDDPDRPPMPADLRATVERLHGITLEQPDDAIPEIQRAIERYPDEPTLLNFLSAAHSAVGNDDKAFAAAEENYRRNPKYLFAKLNYAEILLRRGDCAKVKEIMDNKFDLKLQYPHRDLFHISEYAGLAGLAGIYFAKIGEFDAAKCFYDTLKKLAPGHTATLRLGRHLGVGLLGRMSRLFKAG